MGKKYWEECGNCDGKGYFSDYHGGCYEGSTTCSSCGGKGGRVREEGDDRWKDHEPSWR